MLKERELSILEEEIKHYKPLLGSVSDTIMEQDVSEYPVFILCRNPIEAGIPLNTEQIEGYWEVNASTLEEFAAKQLILPEKVEDFKSIYKDPSSFLCLFVVDENGATFVFVPRH